MLLKVNQKGKPVLNRILKILDLTFEWKLQPRDFEVAVELLYKNILLIEEGVKDKNIRMEAIFSKKFKEKVAKDLKMSYNAVANSITKLRKSYLGNSPIISENNLNTSLSVINPDKENLTLTVIFNESKNNN